MRTARHANNKMQTTGTAATMSTDVMSVEALPLDFGEQLEVSNDGFDAFEEIRHVETLVG